MVKQSWWNLERARLKELYDNDSDMPCGILIEFERCNAQHEKEMQEQLCKAQHEKEMQEKKTYCNLCNGEDEATICIWCHKAKMQELKDVPVDLLHTFRCSDAYELGKKETLKEVFALLKQTRWMEAERKSWLCYLNKKEKELGGREMTLDERGRRTKLRKAIEDR
jgi:hypothetical protein